MPSSAPVFSTNRIGRRGNSRLRLNLPATLFLVDGTRRCRLENISRSGARIAIEQPVKIGDCGFLACEGKQFFGSIVWTRGSSCGLQFDRLLGEQQLLEMRWLGDHHPERGRGTHDWIRGDRRPL